MPAEAKLSRVPATPEERRLIEALDDWRRELGMRHEAFARAVLGIERTVWYLMRKGRAGPSRALLRRVLAKRPNLWATLRPIASSPLTDEPAPDTPAPDPARTAFADYLLSKSRMDDASSVSLAQVAQWWSVWEAAWRAAGAAGRPPRDEAPGPLREAARSAPEQRKARVPTVAMIALLECGLTLPAVAAQLGLSRTGVRKRLQANAIALPPRRRLPPGAPRADKRAYFRRYYLAHREQILDKNRAWSQAHPERVEELRRRREAERPPRPPRPPGACLECGAPVFHALRCRRCQHRHRYATDPEYRSRRQRSNRAWMARRRAAAAGEPR